MTKSKINSILNCKIFKKEVAVNEDVKLVHYVT